MAPRSRRSSHQLLSSCSRACTWRDGSTRTAGCRGRSTGDDRSPAPMTSWTPDRRDLRDRGEGIAPRDVLLGRSARFSRWDGTQSVPELDADEILDQLADDVMAEGDIASALRRL